MSRVLAVVFGLVVFISLQVISLALQGEVFTGEWVVANALVMGSVVLWWGSSYTRKVMGEINVRDLAAVAVLLPFVGPYVFIGDISLDGSSVYRVNIPLIAAVLGGLMLTSASISGRVVGHGDKLVSIAKKFIVCTVLLVLYAPFAFTVIAAESDAVITGLDNGIGGTVKWISFGAAAAILYGGLGSFLLAIIELSGELPAIGNGGNEDLQDK